MDNKNNNTTTNDNCIKKATLIAIRTGEASATTTPRTKITKTTTSRTKRRTTLALIRITLKISRITLISKKEKAKTSTRSKTRK